MPFCDMEFGEPKSLIVLVIGLGEALAWETGDINHGDKLLASGLPGALVQGFWYELKASYLTDIAPKRFLESARTFDDKVVQRA